MKLNLTRGAALSATAAILMDPGAALASRQDDKRKFIAQCDESISIERLAGAPHKFVGKKVDIHGIVGPAMQDTRAFNLNSGNDPSLFVIVIGDARSLEQRQAVRVLGVVEQPQSGQTTNGGGGTFAVLRARFVE